MDDLFETIVAEAEVLLELPDAARAEAWVSGALAEWRRPGDPEPDEIDRAFFAHLAARGGPVALALATAAAGLAEPAVAAAASEVVASLAGTVAAPRWAAGVGGSVAVAAVSVRRGEAESIVVEFADDGDGHTLLVEIDHDAGGAAVDARLGPPGLVEAALAEDPDLAPVELSVEQASARIRSSLAVPHADPSDELVMNRLVVGARVGLRSETVPRVAAATREPDPEGDAAAVEILRSALRGRLAAYPPAAELQAAEAALAAALTEGDPDTVHAAGAAGATEIVAVAGAYVAPRRLDGFTPAERDAVLGLEWADWLGAVLTLVREGPGADASPTALVTGINRCPEVTTSIPKQHRGAVAHAFSLTLHAWAIVGAIDDDDRLTPLGAWLLPRALARAWGADLDR